MAQGGHQWRRAGHHWRWAGHHCTLWDYHWLQISCVLPGVACPPLWLDTDACEPKRGSLSPHGSSFSSTSFQLSPPMNLQLDPSPQNSLHGSWHDLELLFETSNGRETWNGGRLRLQTAGGLGTAGRLGKAGSLRLGMAA